MNINKELLLEDIIFPVRFDGYMMYLFDKENNMIAMSSADRNINAKVLKRIEDAINTYKDNLDRPLKESPKVTLKDGTFYDVKGKEFLITRGWGRLKYKSNPELRQDNISNYILMAINTYVVKEEPDTKDDKPSKYNSNKPKTKF